MTGRIAGTMAGAALVAALAGCAPPPGPTPATGAYPRLVPVEPILARAAQPGATEQDTEALEARAAALRATAAALRARDL
ncbi:hypothetical protein NHN26_13540 [Rhodovulum tesquicola]|uniref:hypothetical protein n=1 Tax=Rhodovulum tesquicola TaxID=540254 RepID=UPI0020985E2F|nr:hypothetical protein [Rhodovulum tesquicola]MCO8146245.1 hypothetical protein [Rhodovulum tesquicola]